jgi:hypothetical protein
MGILPMSITGVPPVSSLLPLLLFCAWEEPEKEKKTTKAKSPRVTGSVTVLASKQVDFRRWDFASMDV